MFEGSANDQNLEAAASAFTRGLGRSIDSQTFAHASRICGGAIVETGEDAFLIATLGRAIAGHSVHVIVGDDREAQSLSESLAGPAKLLALTASKIHAGQSDLERRHTYRADIVVCPLMQLLRDRTSDLLQWPVKNTAAHRQFDLMLRKAVGRAQSFHCGFGVGLGLGRRPDVDRSACGEHQGAR